MTLKDQTVNTSNPINARFVATERRKGRLSVEPLDFRQTRTTGRPSSPVNKDAGQSGVSPSSGTALADRDGR